MKLRTGGQGSQSSEVLSALQACRQAVGGIAVFSAIINILMLSGSLYMLQVYDRVLSSRSISTLVGISLILLAAYILQGSLDTLRSKMLARVGARFDELLSGRIFDLIATLPCAASEAGRQHATDPRPRQHSRVPVRNGPDGAFDMPFMPVFFVCCFLIHPWIGVMSVMGGMVIIVALTHPHRGEEPRSDVGPHQEPRGAPRARRDESAERGGGSRARDARVLGRAVRGWNAKHVDDGLRASNAASDRGCRQGIPHGPAVVGALGLGAYFVICNEMTGGAMIAASILMSRAPARSRSRSRTGRASSAPPGLSPPRAHPVRGSACTPGSVFRPRRRRWRFRTSISVRPAPPPDRPSVSIQMRAGQGLGLIGPSASGKSTLRVRSSGFGRRCERGAARRGDSSTNGNPTTLAAMSAISSGCGTFRRHGGRQHRPLPTGRRA